VRLFSATLGYHGWLMSVIKIGQCCIIAIPKFIGYGFKIIMCCKLNLLGLKITAYLTPYLKMGILRKWECPATIKKWVPNDCVCNLVSLRCSILQRLSGPVCLCSCCRAAADRLSPPPGYLGCYVRSRSFLFSNQCRSGS
jgi:hypothetical protein